jgi:hypothetical protein
MVGQEGIEPDEGSVGHEVRLVGRLRHALQDECRRTGDRASRAHDGDGTRSAAERNASFVP